MKLFKNKLGNECSDCKNIITLDNIAYNYTGKVLKRCKSCHNKYVVICNVNAKRISRYGINSKEFNKLKEFQLGGCAICKQANPNGIELAIDHDHLTGKIRDLLCNRCNLILGYLNEDEDILINMIEYLKKHSKKIA